MGPSRTTWWHELPTEQEDSWHQTEYSDLEASMPPQWWYYKWAPGSPPLLRRTACVGYINQENQHPLACSLPMDLHAHCPSHKGEGVWWGERDKRQAIFFWLVLTLGQAGQLISNEFSKPSWKSFDVLTTLFFFLKKEEREGKRQEGRKTLCVCIYL